MRVLGEHCLSPRTTAIRGFVCECAGLSKRPNKQRPPRAAREEGPVRLCGCLSAVIVSGEGSVVKVPSSRALDEYLAEYTVWRTQQSLSTTNAVDAARRSDGCEEAPARPLQMALHLAKGYIENGDCEAALAMLYSPILGIRQAISGDIFRLLLQRLLCPLYELYAAASRSPLQGDAELAEATEGQQEPSLQARSPFTEGERIVAFLLDGIANGGDAWDGLIIDELVQSNVIQESEPTANLLSRAISHLPTFLGSFKSVLDIAIALPALLQRQAGRAGGDGERDGGDDVVRGALVSVLDVLVALTARLFAHHPAKLCRLVIRAIHDRGLGRRFLPTLILSLSQTLGQCGGRGAIERLSLLVLAALASDRAHSEMLIDEFYLVISAAPAEDTLSTLKILPCCAAKLQVILRVLEKKYVLNFGSLGKRASLVSRILRVISNLNSSQIVSGSGSTFDFDICIFDLIHAFVINLVSFTTVHSVECIDACQHTVAMPRMLDEESLVTIAQTIEHLAHTVPWPPQIAKVLARTIRSMEVLLPDSERAPLPAKRSR